jgi:hypothetical protein
MNRFGIAGVLWLVAAGLAIAEARTLIVECIGAKRAPAPFEIKGGRSARIFAETIVDAAGVPVSFADAFTALAGWIAAGAPVGTRIDMATT